MVRPVKGDRVRVRYIGTLENGRIFSAAEERPLEFTIGDNQIFPHLEQEIVEMLVGETRNIVLKAEDAYGARLAGNIIKVERSQFPDKKALQVGEKLEVQFKGGAQRVMLISALSDEYVTLDGNHPLAGCDLTFALCLESIV